LDVQLRLPDLWQQQAIRALQDGRDVVVAAPTGSGKTYVFELLMESGIRGNAVYTVPTRALANDKLLEWRARNWDVGIATGDLSENTGAPVVVATLEAQKNRFLYGNGPAILVIDEYQMLGDRNRGVNYELVIAMAPADTQLLMMSGSVGNPQSVVEWLRRLGRDAVLVSHKERPVPLDEVNVEALPDRGVPSSVTGAWPRAIARALKAGMAPLLTFAPRRRAAEQLAFDLARMLPEEDPLLLTPEQKRLAGDSLARLLKLRIAYHHSGLDYRQRAGLIEPLAKAGQLRVVVATMGLSSGINFSMRSVLVTDREYRSGDHTHLVRPDELLQMFGRAGRRGIDKKGYILVAPGKPRLSEARPLILKRTNQVDWPSILRVMHEAHRSGRNVIEAALEVSDRLFSKQRVPLGIREFRAREPRPQPRPPTRVQSVREVLTPDERWERKRAPRHVPFSGALVWTGEKWLPALAHPSSLAHLDFGTLCRIGKGAEMRYGREIPIARMGKSAEEGELVLTRWARARLQSLREQQGSRKRVTRTGWTLNTLQKVFDAALPALTGGGTVAGWNARNDVFFVTIGFEHAQVAAFVDSQGRGLLRAPEREHFHEIDLAYGGGAEAIGAAGDGGANGGSRPRARTPAEAWFELELIDAKAVPTRRGILFSFFNHGEGLAIAAALEDKTYPIEELTLDLANLRAGHRFSDREEFSGRLGSLCRATYRGATYPGYLNKGVPEDYGDGAAETIAHVRARGGTQRAALTTRELLSGDIERAMLEWRSLLTHVAHAPDLEWDRWRELQAEARRLLAEMPHTHPFHELPPLTAVQRQRHKSFLRFD